jgi:pyridinium-3,5-biscarboxylic acid mononucleotide synthase
VKSISNRRKPRNSDITKLGIFAQVDHGRQKRRGFPEVIYCANKTPLQIIAIAREILKKSDQLLATRLDPSIAGKVSRALRGSRYHPEAKILSHVRKPLPKYPGKVAIVAAGTSDYPIAEEAAITAEVMGNLVERHYDVGIAGIHRLLAVQPELQKCAIIVAIAGMEGTLPGVVAGLVDKPVIAVPTSVGYGSGLGGLSALLSMLNSCSSGITVVNIDNGFGAAYAATLINRQIVNLHR